MMPGILICSYRKGMRSSRKISKACEAEIPFCWISGNIAPDHRATCRFRARHEKEFKTLKFYACAPRPASSTWERSFWMGTRMKANAALSANHTLDHINKILEEKECLNMDRFLRGKK